jgi:hypothetical protein
VCCSDDTGLRGAVVAEPEPAHHMEHPLPPPSDPGGSTIVLRGTSPSEGSGAWLEPGSVTNQQRDTHNFDQDQGR